jgi:hypothetical protein
MERLVVLAVDPHELVGLRDVDRAHLVVDVGAADERGQLGLRDLALEHGPRGMPERREDDRPGVDQGAVEVEEDVGVGHGVDRIDGPVP